MLLIKIKNIIPPDLFAYFLLITTSQFKADQQLDFSAAANNYFHY